VALRSTRPIRPSLLGKVGQSSGDTALNCCRQQAQASHSLLSSVCARCLLLFRGACAWPLCCCLKRNEVDIAMRSRALVLQCVACAAQRATDGDITSKLHCCHRGKLPVKSSRKLIASLLHSFIDLANPCFRPTFHSFGLF